MPLPARAFDSRRHTRRTTATSRDHRKIAAGSAGGWFRGRRCGSSPLQKADRRRRVSRHVERGLDFDQTHFVTIGISLSQWNLLALSDPVYLFNSRGCGQRSVDTMIQTVDDCRLRDRRPRGCVDMMRVYPDPGRRRTETRLAGRCERRGQSRKNGAEP